MSRHVTENVCFKSGHEMITLESGKPLIEPVNKIAIYEKQVLCKKCGLSVEQIQNYRPLPKSTRKEAS